MQIYSELVRDIERPLVVAVGFFDGLHRGHRVLIEEARRLRRPGWRVGVLTFANHPAAFLRPGAEPANICTAEERIRLFAQAGIEECFAVPFDAGIANLTPAQFLDDVLLKRLGVRVVVIGSTFRFGHQRAGDAQTMLDFAAAHEEFEVVAVPPVGDEIERISSTRIRQLIAAGQTEEADRLLGHSYEIRGIVERGAGRGHVLGFPTANVRSPAKLLPKDGVYAAVARFDGRDYAALVSIGTNPTFVSSRAKRSAVEGQAESAQPPQENARTIEAWIRDFHFTIYGQELALRDLRFVREQQAFGSADELVAQMHTDKEAVAYPSY